ncbi:MAG: hypothetical protein HC789_19680 [Microcoleus sp. CSU_2_2]|nr:hypothetical protein [Microcoleus sp. SU_5_3]NJS12436.1 hypothetical protein [Microcoleus sp. CSU_2_2]
MSKAKNENLTGSPTSAEEIANALNELTPATSHRWQAGFIDTSTPLAAFNLLLNTKQSWMAQMKECSTKQPLISHARQGWVRTQCAPYR